jgi:hypothetical protein
VSPLAGPESGGCVPSAWGQPAPDGLEADADGSAGERPGPGFRVIDLLRQYTPAYLDRFGRQAVPQVQKVLAKLALCRTLALGGHTYECPKCHHRCQVFIEPPPTKDANPEHVLKYLARYLTGGPISDRRLIDHQDGKVTFWARGHDKKSGNQREPCTLRGDEFTCRWALHILPKGFVKSRCFGGFSCRHRKTYLDRCRTLLDLKQAVAATGPVAVTGPAEASPATPRCPRCQTPMTCVVQGERVSWRKVLSGRHCPPWYDLFNHAIRWGCRHWYREPPDG